MGGSQRRPVWLVPQAAGVLPAMPDAQKRLTVGIALGVVALVAAVPAYVFLAPHSQWQPESLVIVLLVLSFVSHSAGAHVRGGVTLDATFVGALVALVFLGPLPCAVVFAAPELSAWIERRRVMSLLGNTAACAWGALAGAWTLAAFTSGVPPDPVWRDLPAIAAAGVGLLVVGYLVTTLLVAVVWERLKLATLIEQEIAEQAPACAILLVTGTVTTLLYEELGLVGLSPLAFLVLVPRAFVPLLSQSRDPTRLALPDATALYGRAIAAALDLDSTQKRILLDAATHVGTDKRLTRIEDFDRVMQTVLYRHEHWDGEGGFPGIISGEAIPIESRVLAVAEQLAALTAKETRGLSPQHAVAMLVTRAGNEFDPRVVAAARRVVDQELLVSSRPARSRASMPHGAQPRSANGLAPAVGAQHPLEPAPHEVRQQRHELPAIGLRILRPPRGQ